MNYKFETFTSFHFSLMIYAIALFVVFYYIHKIIPEQKLSIYATVFGILVLGLKIFDSLNLYYVEQKDIIILLPLHICNISLICGAIYLITKKEIFFSVLYFFSYGALIALIMPDWRDYNTLYYPYVYYTTHIMEYIILAFGLIQMKVKINRESFKNVAMIQALILITAYIVDKFNPNINFMFLNDYAIPALSFIKPFWFYIMCVILVYYILLFIMYGLTKIKFKNKRRQQ